MEYIKNNNGNVKFDLTAKVDFTYWEERVCPICGRHFLARKKYEKITCSEECLKAYVELHKDEIKAKQSKRLKEANAKKPIEVKQAELAKARKTCLEKYGVDMRQKTPEYRAMMSKMFKEKDWSHRNSIIREKMIKKYTEICNNDDLELLDFRNRFDATVKCKKCGNVFDVHVLGYTHENTKHNLCRFCHPFGNLTRDSKASDFVKDILDEYGVQYYKNNRSVLGNIYEIDFYLPSLSIGIEVNGNYWHSEFANNRGKNYHIDKTKWAYEKGVKLIQIFEDEIVHKPEIVKSRILNLIGKTPHTIYARKCKIKELTPTEKKKFFVENHIDGDSISKYNVGLVFNNEIVAAASFGKRMISKRPTFELVRFATKKYTNVVGGFSKILKFAVETYNIDSITTYADMRWSGMDWKNNFYNKNGFEFKGYTQPNYFYMDKKNYLIRLNRMNFQKKKLIKEGYDASKTETEIMLERGFDRIWDCGSMKFIYNKKGDY